MRGRRSAEKKQVERKRCNRAKQRKETEISPTHKRNKKQNSPGIVDCSVIM